MKYQFKTIYLNSSDNVAKAEKMQQNGWKVIQGNFYFVQMERIKPNKK